MIASYLLQSSNDEESFIIETVWESPEALERMRREETPAAPALFQRVGVKPKLEIYNVSQAI